MIALTVIKTPPVREISNIIIFSLSDKIIHVRWYFANIVQKEKWIAISKWRYKKIILVRKQPSMVVPFLVVRGANS